MAKHPSFLTSENSNQQKSYTGTQSGKNTNYNDVIHSRIPGRKIPMIALNIKNIINYS